jgi:hypothetical protein
MAGTRSEATVAPSIRDRRGLRITLLSLAAAILLLGAAAAGAYGYIEISHGTAAGGAAERALP